METGSKTGRIKGNKITGSNNKITINEAAPDLNGQYVFEFIETLKSNNTLLQDKIAMQEELIKKLRGQLSQFNRSSITIDKIKGNQNQVTINNHWV